METVTYFKEKDVKFITPLGVTSHLKNWGVHESKLFETDWWGKLEFEGITFVCTPAQHFSGRLGTLKKGKVGRPFKAGKKEYQVVRIEKSLGSELDKYLPVYSKKVNFKVSMTGIVEKSIRECLVREKEDV
jgi:hypothetical protein